MKATKVEESPVNKVDRLATKFKQQTVGLFHNALWQILVNNCTPNDGKSCLTYLQVGNEVGLVRANEKGYIPCNFGFKDEIPVKEREQIVNNLNEEIFDLEDKESCLIVLTSL